MQKWSRFFDIVAYKELGLGYQDLIVLRRARSVAASPTAERECRTEKDTGEMAT